MLVRLEPYQGQDPAPCEPMGAWAVLAVRGDPGPLTLELGPAVEAGGEPLVWLRWAGPEPDLVLWRDRLWTTCDWWALKPNPYGRFQLPRIKRAYPVLIASQLTSVQPLTAPASLLLYMRYQYSKAGNTTP